MPHDLMSGMSHYRSNLRDIEFMLFDVLNVDERLGRGSFAELDATTAHEILAEVERLSTGPVAESYAISDRTPPLYDPATCSVTMPDAFRKSYQAYMDAEWWRLDIPPEAGGTACPRSIWWAAIEMIQGAQAAVYMFSGGPSFGGLLHTMGTDEQKQIAQHMIDKRWGATMVLTEPDAGSDVGAGRTIAKEQGDGSWHIEGVKRFITSGEHDMAENIVHFVLARPKGHGPGTKGLSMFLVPKYHFDVATGELGDRNGVYATNVEKKMGLKVSTTCELTFGAEQPAVGWLVGEAHDGIAQMFKVIEAARMQVGVKAIGTLSTGYLNALDYARERVQGPDLTQRLDKSAPRVTTESHPDVRRMLLLQKAYAEGLRALYLYTADWLDRAAGARDGGDDGRAEANVNDLLLPVVKGVGSERSYELLALALQTLGGSGFLQDYPIEQYARDTKIDSLYEGTTGIQGMDFFFRKIVRDRRTALDTVFAEITATLDAIGDDPRFKDEHEAITEALGHVDAMVRTMVEWDAAAAEAPRQIYRVGQNSTRLLMSVGDLLVAWLLTRQAVIAQAKLDAGSSDAYFTGKIAVTRFFATTVLPELAARRRVLEQTDNAIMDIPREAF